MLLLILGVRSTFRNIYICSQFCGWSGQRKAGEGLPSQHSNETLPKAQGVALNLRQPTRGPTFRGGPTNLQWETAQLNQHRGDPSPRPPPRLALPQGWGSQHHPKFRGYGPAHSADKMGPQNAPWAPGRREPFLSTPSLGDCRLESPKMVFTIQLAAINYSRPHFPQTHGLSLLAR